MKSNLAELRVLRRLLVPSLASVVIHLALLAVVLAATITVASRPGPRPRLTELAIAPVNPESNQNVDRPQLPEASPRSAASPMPAPSSLRAPVLTSAHAAVSASASPAPAITPVSSSQSMLRDEPEASRQVSFAGVKARAARRIVYVVDASGSMVNSYAFIRARLIQSINQLSPTQQFSIILARSRPENPGVSIMDLGTGPGLVRALPSNKQAAINWLREVVVGGRSAPLAGLEAALTLKPGPELVFLLSRGFMRTDSGAWTGVEAALDRLDKLNPKSRWTGRRPVVVKTLQFLDDDPTGLMQAIAESHGDGPGSFRVLTIDDLAAADSQDEATSPDPRVDASVEKASQILVDADEACLEILYGMARPAAKAQVLQAINKARGALGPRLGPTDLAGAAIRARIKLLESALEHDPELARQAGDMLGNIFLVDPEADAARRLSLICAHALTNAPEQAQQEVDELAEDIRALNLSPAIASELAVACIRYGLSGPSRTQASWALLRAQAQVQFAIESGRAGRKVFNPLFDWAGTDDSRRAKVGQILADLWSTLPERWFAYPRFRFALAMGLRSEHPKQAVKLFKQVSDDPDAGSLALEALWESAVLMQDYDPKQACSMLERFARTAPEDPRARDAIRACVALSPRTDTDSLQARLALALTRLPEDPQADAWRFELASLSPAEDALVLLSRISSESASAPSASDLTYALTSKRDARPTIRRMGSRILRSLGDDRWQLVHAALVESLLVTDPTSALIEAKRLDASIPEFGFLLARAQISAGEQYAGLVTLDKLTRALSPDEDLFWSTWRLLLDTLAQDPKQADAIRAHLYRLRLIKPDFDTSRWETPTANLADAPTDP